MGLYERLMGLDDLAPRVPVHQFTATLAEFGRGAITGAQARAAISAASGAPLTPEEETEATTLLGTVTGTLAAKLARAKEIDDVLILAHQRTPPYNTPALVKTRLGV